jgi:hypothetical protein
MSGWVRIWLTNRNAFFRHPFGVGTTGRSSLRPGHGQPNRIRQPIFLAKRTIPKCQYKYSNYDVQQIDRYPRRFAPCCAGPVAIPALGCLGRVHEHVRGGWIWPLVSFGRGCLDPGPGGAVAGLAGSDGQGARPETAGAGPTSGKEHLRATNSGAKEYCGRDGWIFPPRIRYIKTFNQRRLTH